jgi:hypothetical protein
LILGDLISSFRNACPLKNHIRCGNGLLTHILTAEGYKGKGIDVRARASWAQYPDTTQAQLHVCAFDPTSSSSYPFILPGVFIIGNHADELTPWVPVLATLHKASGYLSIPCCAWSFDAKFERSSASFFPINVSSVDSQPPTADKSGIRRDTGLSLQFVEGLNLGGDGNHTSSYSIYRIWLSTLSLHCGWQIECETLRIPSTRNWAIAGTAIAFPCSPLKLTYALCQGVGEYPTPLMKRLWIMLGLLLSKLLHVVYSKPEVRRASQAATSKKNHATP